MVHPLKLSVEHNGEVVDRIERLPRRLPDGRIGVEYMGLVYPIMAAGRVSTDGRWCYPSEAPICLEPPELPTDCETPVWSLEKQGARPYIFVDGSEELLKQMIARLGEAGITAEHWGPSFREGPSGRLYDWFIRLPADSAAATTQWELNQIFVDLQPVADSETRSEETAEAALAKARHRTQRLVERQVLAERQLAEALSTVDDKGKEIAQIEKRSQNLRRQLETEIAFLRAGIASLETRKAASPRTTNPVEDLQREISCLREENAQALEAWAQADAESAQTRRRLEEQSAELEEVRTASVTTRCMRVSRRRRSSQEFETVLRVFAPEVRLMRDCAEFVATEVEDWRDLLTKLRLLTVDPPAMRGKRVHTADGWLEVHFSTGRGRDGRLYYKRLHLDGGPLWGVLISDKAAQHNDIEWLGGQ